MAYGVTYRICVGLQQARGGAAGARREDRISKRLPYGEFIEGSCSAGAGVVAEAGVVLVGVSP
jgi:hypothetical protein